MPSAGFDSMDGKPKTENDGMKHLDEYRQPERCQALVETIRRTVTRPRTIMEVCGGQTHGLLAHGIDTLLNGSVELIHGPGCPVCVTPAEEIDFAVRLAERPEVLVASFGDMLRVPGTAESLQQVRGRGGDVRLVYSPLDAAALAKRHPEMQVVFFAVGFETTAPATALAVLQADRWGLENFSLLVSHVRVQPAMESIMQAPECRVEGFLAAGHVCTVSGYESYRQFVRRYGVPVVVTGFEPFDLLAGILECVTRIEAGKRRSATAIRGASASRATGKRYVLWRKSTKSATGPGGAWGRFQTAGSDCGRSGDGSMPANASPMHTLTSHSCHKRRLAAAAARSSSAGSSRPTANTSARNARPPLRWGRRWSPRRAPARRIMLSGTDVDWFVLTGL
jgi:hypothetical protein